MSDANLITKGEEDILAAIGYLVMRWNYAEYFARQTLRQYLVGESMEDSDHIRLSSRPASWLEDQLRTDVLPRWTEPGRTYLERLILAFSRGREHRNHLIHGIYMTHGASGPYEPQGILVPSMPRNGKPQIPSHVVLSEIRSIANHFHDLAMFARDVNVGFAGDGALALNPNGRSVLVELPALLVPLEPPRYQTL